jgi:hypothetical protein
MPDPVAKGKEGKAFITIDERQVKMPKHKGIVALTPDL